MILDMRNPDHVELIDRLRDLRKWHWQQAMRSRALQYEIEELLATRKGRNTGLKDCIKRYNKTAGFHLTQVQTLNELFPIGDTAEQDVANETDDRSEA